MEIAADGAVRPIRLTAHPLQRVGAYALAALAGVDDSPETLSWTDFDRATERMTTDLIESTPVSTAKDPGGYWLALSYTLWPNSPLNATNRARQTPRGRAHNIRYWRQYPRSGDLIEVGCLYCGATPAIGWYGKVDIPLAASVRHRNHTAPGHQGIPLCSGCLASFHALPYGCGWRGGKLHTVHTWDDDLLARIVTDRVNRTTARAGGDTNEASPDVAAEALDVLAALDRPTHSQLELMKFTNSNQRQELSTDLLSEVIAEWWRQLNRGPDGSRTVDALGTMAAHGTDTEPSRKLAFLLFHAPHSLLRMSLPLIVDELDNGAAETRTGWRHPATVGALRILTCVLIEE
ncbi:hypothetical protein [Nocardia carnea]|uniref:hypothetical protein n=1 Tax=Nocardia carnea TaxID=37328 RepID=UPI0024584BD9|nr:hypothetical protein [Nocardia carnea]